MPDDIEIPRPLRVLRQSRKILEEIDHPDAPKHFADMTAIRRRLTLHCQDLENELKYEHGLSPDGQTLHPRPDKYADQGFCPRL